MEQEITAAPLRAKFFGNGRQPRCAPNPAYPNGKAMDLAPDEPGCTIDLQHPTPCCGFWLVSCDLCKTNAAITAAGRPDDPSTVRIPCKRLAGSS